MTENTNSPEEYVAGWVTVENYRTLVAALIKGDEDAAGEWLDANVRTEAAHFALLGYLPMSISLILKLSGREKKYDDAADRTDIDMSEAMAGLLVADAVQYGISKELAADAHGLMVLGAGPTRLVLEALMEMLNQEAHDVVVDGTAHAVMDAENIVRSAAERG